MPHDIPRRAKDAEGKPPHTNNSDQRNHGDAEAITKQEIAYPSKEKSADSLTKAAERDRHLQGSHAEDLVGKALSPEKFAENSERNQVDADLDKDEKLTSEQSASASDASEIDEPRLKVLRSAEELVGSLQFRGGTLLDSTWMPTGKTQWRQKNDFSEWACGDGPEPDESGTMNCWEAIMYSAYRADCVDKEWLKKVHEDASQSARSGKSLEEQHNNYYGTLEKSLWEEKPSLYNVDQKTGTGSPDIPAGHLIVINNLDHVMLSCGTRDPQGRQEVLNLLDYPQRFPPGPRTISSYGVMQKGTVEEVLGGLDGLGPDNTIKFGSPAWQAQDTHARNRR